MISSLIKFAAYLSLGLGLIGLFVPGLPTVPFVLLSLLLLNKSDPQLAEKIKRCQAWRKEVENWERKKSISMRSKIIATAFISSSLYWIWIQKEMKAIHTAVLVLLAACLIFIWTRPRS